MSGLIDAAPLEDQSKDGSPRPPSLPPCRKHTCSEIDFADRTDGHVRIRSPRTHEPAEMMPRWTQTRLDRRALGPHGVRPGEVQIANAQWLGGREGTPLSSDVVACVFVGQLPANYEVDDQLWDQGDFTH